MALEFGGRAERGHQMVGINHQVMARGPSKAVKGRVSAAPVLSSLQPPDCEPPLKKEGGLPEGPVLEALLCAETGDKKPELKEEELNLDCPVREMKDTHPLRAWPPP